MWPFAGLLVATSYELKVPGQDSTYAVSDSSIYPEKAYAGLKWFTDGHMAKRVGDTYTTITDTWISEGAQGTIDGGLYECRYTSLMGDTSFFETDLTPDVWSDLAEDHYVQMVAGAPSFSPPVFYEVNLIVQVREKANTDNIRSGNIQLSVSYEGLS